MAWLIAWYIAYRRRCTYWVIAWAIVPYIGGIAAIIASCCAKPIKPPLPVGTKWYNRDLFARKPAATQ